MSVVDIKKGNGTDNVSPLILKNCAISLAKPLQLLFNSSIDQCKYPDIWKKSYINPLHKKGNKNDASNYRAIIACSNFAKLFDRLIAQHLNIFFEPCPEQHGFIKGRSTLTNLMELNHIAAETLAKQKQLDIIYLDFNKAFDTIKHSIIITKLANLQYSHDALKWFSSFLSNRSLRVKINNELSYPFIPSSGVPQGNPASSILFLIVINDLPSSISNSHVLLFADDAKIFQSISNSNDSKTLQRSINEVNDWCELNSMTINISKCKAMSISRSKKPIINNYCYQGIEIERVNEFSDLGVIFTSSLRFNKHIENIINKATIVLGFIRRLCADFSPNTTKILYTSLIRPILEYCSPIWNPHRSQIL